MGGLLSFTPHNTLTRLVGEKRKYTTSRVAKEKAPTKPRTVKSLEAIADGTCFPTKKRPLSEGETPTCCTRQCNVKFGAEEGSLARVRSKVPLSGPGQQTARKVFVQSCLQDGKDLVLGDSSVELSMVVCQLFFVAVTGFSKNMIQSAMQLGGPAM